MYEYIQDVLLQSQAIKLRQKFAPSHAGSDGLDKEITQQIKVDLARTNTTALSKTKHGQQQLERVLRAIAFMNPQIGYCQGMNFMVSIILEITGNNEHISFLIF